MKPSVSTHVPRVTQIDSKSLDEEVYAILKSTFTSSFQYGGQNFLVKFQPEFEAALKLILFHCTLGKNSQSVGQKLLQIKYNQNDKKLSLYILSFIVAAWLKQRLSFFASFIKTESVKSSTVKLFEVFETVYQVADLVNLMHFLVRGKCATILERLFNLRVIPVDQDKVRTIAYAYFTRELLWNGFADLLTTTLPLIPARKFHNSLLQFLPNSFNSQRLNQQVSEEADSGKSETQCKICNELAVLPQRFGCKHIACYYCIYSAIQTSPFRCPICGIKIDNSSEIIRM